MADVHQNHASPEGAQTPGHKRNREPLCNGDGSVAWAEVALPPQVAMAVLDRSPVGICILKDNLIYFANPVFHTMTGHDPGSIEGQPARMFYPTTKEFRRVSRYLISEVKRFGTGTIDTRLLRRDNTTFDCRVRASWINPEDPGCGMLVMTSDITEIRSAQIQKQQVQKMEAIGVLAGGVSHDFNNLLMGIQGHLSLMRMNINRPDKVGRHIGQMAKLVETAADLTGRLLGFARGGKYQISILDVNQVVSMALNVFEPTRKNIIIQQEPGESLHLVKGDHSQLEQVLLHLLVNGSQAMIDGGTLTITTRNVVISRHDEYHFNVPLGPYVEILVKDTGMGMDAAIQKKIFDPFFSTQMPGNKKGRGLGLSTVFGIVKNHGGFITVKSGKGKGSTFRVCLPAGPEKGAAAPAWQEDSQQQVPTGSETILLVDDEIEVLSLGKDFLEQLGYKPLLATNGLEAVEMFKSCHKEIALVVLDLLMPNMDGREAFFELRRIDPEIKVLISTGVNVDHELRNLMDDGCHGILQKPFSLEKLSRAVRDIIDGKTRFCSESYLEK